MAENKLSVVRYASIVRHVWFRLSSACQFALYTIRCRPRVVVFRCVLVFQHDSLPTRRRRIYSSLKNGLLRAVTLSASSRFGKTIWFKYA
jgi:hypothetical protein